jgi:Zn-dependent metalloprotease
MSLRRVVVMASAGVLVAGVAAVAASTAEAQPAPNAAPSAQSLAATAATSFVAAKPAALHASASDKFVQHAVVSSGGLQYVPFDRTYKNLPVVGGDFVVVSNSAGQVMDTSVAQDKTINLASVTPKLSAAQAEATARKQLKSVTSTTAPQLVVYAHGNPELAYQTVVTGTGTEGYSKLAVTVDATTGKVLESRERVMHDVGTGNTAWAGQVQLNTTLSGSTYSMKDPVTTNLSCQDAANNTTFSGTDNVWGNSTASNKETGCADALYASQTETKMLSAWLGRNAPNGSGGAWPLRVGLNDENAYYDGSQVQIGHNTNGGWIGSMDVVGHEQGHGIDDNTPGGISGGNTQEFVADTFGAATEWYANNSTDQPDFLVGEQVNLVGSGPIRNMYNPSALGDDNCYSSSIPNEEVHAAAGPGNHWFYLLAEGTNPTNGQPTSSTCNSSTVTGVGIQNAIKIMYNAMLMKTSSSSYLKYRTWTLTAAKNLDSTCGLFNATKAAWNAVSVPAQTGDPTCGSTGTLTVGNPGNKTGTVGTAITAFTITASGGTSPYHFSATGLPPGISINATSGQVSGTPTSGGTYNVTVNVTDSSSPVKSGSTSFTFTVSGGGGGCGQNLITNGGFESGSTGWTASSGVLGNTSGQTAHGGTQYAWLDGYGTTHTDTLQQSVSIPAGCNATLNYYLHIDSSETTTSVQYDKLTLTVNGTSVATFSNLNKASGYTLRTTSLAAYAGQTVTLKWTGTEDSSLQTSFVIDDVSTS